MAQITQPGHEDSSRVNVGKDSDPPAGALTVLVVDESEDMRVYVTRCLGQFGVRIHRVLEATNGLDALVATRASPINLLICGANMPQMGGQALCTAIRADERIASMLILLLVDDADDKGGLAGLDWPIPGLADAVLKSPFNATSFAECLSKMIGSI